MSFKTLSLTSVALLFTAQAHASLVGANIDITAGNGFASGANICKSAAVAGATVGVGLELTGPDWTGGCVGYYSADVSGDQIVLQGIQGGNYSFATLNIHFNSGAAITGVFFGGYTDYFFAPSYPNNDSNFLPTISFDADDIWITWDTHDDNSQFWFNGPDNGPTPPIGTASFRVQTAAVPEPASIALLGLGLAGLGLSRRRSNAHG